jgi:hypothetical protein
MQMNIYDLNRISLILRDQGVRELHVKVESRFAGFDPCTVSSDTEVSARSPRPVILCRPDAERASRWVTLRS